MPTFIGLVMPAIVAGRIFFGVETPDPLASMPFSYATRSDGTIVISYRTAPVTILRGRSAERFTTRISGGDAAAAQQLMARATGNFKRGNERVGKRSAR
jgi:hypothetical protein